MDQQATEKLRIAAEKSVVERYFCVPGDAPTPTIDEALKAAKAAEDNDDETELVIWAPFEHYPLSELDAMMQDEVHNLVKFVSETFPAGLLDPRQTATLLAALRLLQQQRQTLPEEIARIASDEDTLEPLTGDEIDGLCELINQ